MIRYTNAISLLLFAEVSAFFRPASLVRRIMYELYTVTHNRAFRVFPGIGRLSDVFPRWGITCTYTFKQVSEESTGPFGLLLWRALFGMPLISSGTCISRYLGGLLGHFRGSPARTA